MSPGFTEVTPSPMLSTIPAPSWPRMTGKSTSGKLPSRTCSSVWQIPVATILTRTSRAFGGATSISSTESDLPAAQATAALHRITFPEVAIWSERSCLQQWWRVEAWRCLSVWSLVLRGTPECSWAPLAAGEGTAGACWESWQRARGSSEEGGRGGPPADRVGC